MQLRCGRSAVENTDAEKGRRGERLDYAQGGLPPSRAYEAHFVSKLSDSEGEAEETRVWLDLAFRCKYISEEEANELDQTYDGILGQLVRMIEHPEQWTIRKHSTQ